MNKQTYSTQGKTTVSADVLLTIARLTTLNVPGVSRLGIAPGIAGRRLKGGHVDDGIVIEIQDDIVLTEIFVVLNSNLNVQNIARKIQIEVARSISEMVGMRVGSVNIHVVDIDYPLEAEAK